MSVVGPIAAKKLQGRECSEVFSLQQNSLVIRSSRPHRRTPAIRGTEFMEFSAGRPLRLDARELDHLAPLLGFFGDEFSEGGRRHRHRLGSQSNQPRLDFRISKDGVDLLVELVDDRRWRVSGRAEPVPTACLISRYELATVGTSGSASDASRWSPPMRADVPARCT